MIGQGRALLTPPLKRLVLLLPGHLTACIDQPPPGRLAAIARHHHAHHTRAASAGVCADRLGDHTVRGGPAGRYLLHQVQYGFHVVLSHFAHLSMIADEMSETTSPAEPYVCPHCDESHEHTHLDPREVVLSLRKRLAAVTTVRAVLLALSLAAGLLLLSPTAVLTFACAGIVAWALAMAAGLVAGSIDLNRRGGSVAAGSRATQDRFMTVSVLAGAAATPILALLLALVGRSFTGGTGLAEAVPVAAGSAVGWLAVSAVVESVRSMRMRNLLGAESRAGEGAREAAVSLDGDTVQWRELVTMALTALLVGVWVLACSLIPLLVVVLVPLHVALAVFSRRMAAGSGAERAAG